MSDTYEARVEAAAKAYRNPGRMLTNTSDGNHYDRMEAALAAADAVVTVEMIAEVVNGHQLGEDWGDDGIGHVGCGDCGEWFGKALEGGWDRAFTHTAEAVHRLYRGEAGA